MAVERRPRPGLVAWTRGALVAAYVALAALGFTGAPLPLVFWTMLLPLLPMAIVLMGFPTWRRICPLAAFGDIGRQLNRGAQRKVPPFLEQWFFVVTLGLLFLMLTMRLLATNGDGRWLGGLLGGLAVAAAVTNRIYTGKSWCNFFCPVGVVERIYTEPNSLPRTGNSQCARCTACKHHCPDIDQENAYWRDVTGAARRLATYAFPGLVLGFYCYYWLRAGTWEAYFDGRWTRVPVSADLVVGSGFFFAPSIPALVAAPSSLLAFCAAAYVMFAALEALLRRVVPDAERRRHLVLALASFTAFCVFYFFAGAPSIRQVPGATRAVAFAVPVVATTALMKRWRRTRTHFIGERGALRLKRSWQSDEPPPADPAEIYAWIKAGEHARERQLAAYENTVRGMLADGLVGRGELRLLEGIRRQLGITEREHERIFARLHEEEGELFAAGAGVESRAQLEGYETALAEALLRDGSDGAVEQLRQAFGVDVADHERVMAKLRDASGALMSRARGHVERAVGLHGDLSSLAAEEPTPAMLLLAALLRRAREDSVRRVLEYLELSGDEDHIASLRVRLSSADLASRQRAVEELSRAHPQGAGLVADLQSVLTGTVDPGAASTSDPLQVLLRLTAASDAYVRAAAVWALAGRRGDAVAHALQTAASDASALVRETALHVEATAGEAAGGTVAASFAALPTIERMQLLRSVALFAEIDAGDLHDLALLTRDEVVQPGDVICVEGANDAGDIFIVLEGSVSVRVGGDSGGEGREVAVLGAGEVLGELAILDGRPRSATVVPHGAATRLLRIPGAAFRGRFLNRPGVMRPLLRTLAARLRKMTRQASSAARHS